jgi:hypothetical protein
LCSTVRTTLPALGTMDTSRAERSTVMGKYFLAWILGVPALVLVLIYLFFH